MTRIIRSFAAAALAAVLSSAAQAQVVTHRDISARMALAMVEAALTACEKSGASVSVAVVDYAGRLRAFVQADKANPHNLELARRKAYTARTFGRPTGEWAQRTADIPALAPQRNLTDVIASRGGLPVKIGNETIGAIGVSGWSTEGDEACAKAGVDRIADQLR